MSYEGPGIYKHYKGGRYEVLGLALQEDTVVKPDEDHVGLEERVFVIYRPLTPGSLLEEREGLSFWARELEVFNDYLHYRMQHRFTKESDDSA